MGCKTALLSTSAVSGDTIFLVSLLNILLLPVLSWLASPEAYLILILWPHRPCHVVGERLRNLSLMTHQKVATFDRFDRSVGRLTG